MAGHFDKRVAIVTGASSPIGIGASVARQLADEGATVALVARGESGLASVAKQIEARGGRARTFPADLSTLEACERVLDEVAQAFGGIDLLVNNAALNHRGRVEKIPAAELARIVQVDLIAPMVLTRLVLPYLQARGGGTIVQVASIAGQTPLPGEAAYSASKFGLRGFSFALREELAGSPIRVCVVSPGPVDTGFLREDLDAVPNVVFANPMSTPETIARAVVRSAIDGRRERTIPVRTGILARLVTEFPWLRRVVLPILERRGRAAKERYRRRTGT